MSYTDENQGMEGKQAAIQVLSNPERIRQQYFNLIRNAITEILLVLPTVNAVQREHNMGIIQELRNAVQRGVKIRILSAEDDFIRNKLDVLRASGIVVRRIETPTETKFKMLVVDQKSSYLVETRDDSKALFKDAVGLAVFSNSKPTVMPFVTIFESFWRETDLYEKARESDKVKDEFVNIAAHELRNPIMPILAGADLLQDKLKLNREKLGEPLHADLVSDLHLIVRNASKLLKLSEDILQVSRIESGTFQLKLEHVDLVSLLQTSILDVEKSYHGQKPGIEIVLESHLGVDKGKPASYFMVFCDAQKISQTFFNLLDNAVRFTAKGKIVVSASLYDEELIIQIKDPGEGINSEIKERLFEKFASKSAGGTGLGLYLSKKIIEAHGGRIWGDNNMGGVGSTFGIAIPIDQQQSNNENTGRGSQDIDIRETQG